MSEVGSDTAEVQSRRKLAELTDLIVPRLTAPAGTNHVRLHDTAPKAFHLGPTGRKLTSDGTFAVERQGRLLCFVLQAEDSTGKNPSTLVGKACLALLCQDEARQVTVEREVPPAPPTGKRGRPQTNPQRESTPVDEVHVIFLVDPADEEVCCCVRDLVSFFGNLNTFCIRERLHVVEASPDNPEAAIAAVQGIINEIACELSGTILPLP